MVGSSPRMRGKQVIYLVDQYSPRLIPAHAGKTGIPSTLMLASPAHPRACGENV